MNNQTIISKINSYLYKPSELLVKWLEGILPRISDSWWNDCVMDSLGYNQRERAKSQGLAKLSDFDLAALLRIANRSWYDIITVVPLPASKRETIRNMLAVRNNWAHISPSYRERYDRLTTGDSTRWSGQIIQFLLGKRIIVEFSAIPHRNCAVLLYSLPVFIICITTLPE